MNKIERVQAVLRGETPDRVPAGFWFHYPSTLTAQETAQEHLKLFFETDMDILKIMQDFTYPITGTITRAADWRKIRFDGTDSPVFEKAKAIIGTILDKMGGQALTLQTMFGPFKAAAFAFGDDVLMYWAKEAPDDVAEGIHIIAEQMVQWLQGYLDLGVDGLYYTAQYAEPGRFTQEEWEKLVKPFDERVLSVCPGNEGKINFLHVCGEPEYGFRVDLRRLAGLKGDIVNWSVKDNGLTLPDGRAFFGGRPILGGMNNKGHLVNGTEEEIRKEAQACIRTAGTAGFMLGADCTIQPPGGQPVDLQRIRAAVSAAHDFPIKNA